MITRPLQKSLKTLSSSLNPAAAEILLQGLKLEEETVAQAAAAALLDSGKNEALVEVLQQWRSWSSGVKDVFLASVSHMGNALSSCLADQEEQAQMNALEYLRLTDAFDLFPQVLSLLKSSTAVDPRLVAHTLFSQVDRLYHHCHPRSSSEPGTHLRNASQIQHRLLEALKEAVAELDGYSHQETVLESLLILSGPESSTVESLLTVATDQTRQATRKLLTESQHPGVLRFLTESLSLSFPKTELLSIVQQRTDPVFVAWLLNEMRAKPSASQCRSLKQLSGFAWLSSPAEQLKKLPAALQLRVIPLLEATATPQKQIDAVKMWLLTLGTAEARESVSSFLQGLKPEMAEEVLKRALQHTDEQVRAWATRHLRNQSGAPAMQELMEQLKSDSEVVRQAARAELGDFTMSRFLDLYETLDAPSCRQAGEMLREIDPDCLNVLQKELTCPIHQRRLKAIRATHSFGLQEDLVETLLEVLDDPEVMLRRAAVEVLGTVPQMKVVQALYNQLEDSSPRVRETVTNSLKQLVTENPELLGETQVE